MPFTIDYEEERNYMQITVDGILGFDEVIAVFNAMSKDGEFVCPNRLWDLRSCKLTLNSEELRSIAEFGVSRDAASGRGAFLLESEVDYGIIRMLQVFRETGQLTVEIFSDENEARAWLET